MASTRICSNDFTPTGDSSKYNPPVIGTAWRQLNFSPLCFVCENFSHRPFTRAINCCPVPSTLPGFATKLYRSPLVPTHVILGRTKCDSAETEVHSLTIPAMRTADKDSNVDPGGTPMNRV